MTTLPKTIESATPLTTGQVAILCKVAPRTVAKWCDKNILDHYIIPGSQDRRIPAGYLIKFIHKYNLPIPQEIAHVEPLHLIRHNQRDE